MTDGYSGIAGKLSKISVSQLHIHSSVAGLHQLPCTVLSREVFLNIGVEIEEVTFQVPHTFLSVHTHTLSVRLMANVSNLSGLSEQLLKWSLSGSLLSKSV